MSNINRLPKILGILLGIGVVALGLILVILAVEDSAGWELISLGGAEIVVAVVLTFLQVSTVSKSLGPRRRIRVQRGPGIVVSISILVVIILVDVPVYASQFQNGSSPFLSTVVQTGSTSSASLSNYNVSQVDSDYLSDVGPTGFGTITVDTANQLLLLATKQNNSIYIFDLVNEIETDVAGFNNPQSVLYVPQNGGRLFVSNAGNGTVDVLTVNDSTYYQVVLKRIAELSFPDPQFFAYDGKSGDVYVGFGSGNDSGIGIVSAYNDSKIGIIPLSSPPGHFVIDQNGSKIFVSIPSTNSVVEIDQTKEKEINSWAVNGSLNQGAIAVDESQGEMFAGSSNPPSVLVYNYSSGSQITSLDLPSPPTDIFFDPVFNVILASCANGTLVVYHELNASSFVSISENPTGPNSTFFVYPQQNEILVAVPPFNDQPSQLLTFTYQ